jgi:large subunit ribosomal protein L18
MPTNMSAVRRTARTRRHFRLRKKVVGSPARPRLVVTRSSRHIGAQLVDDSVGRTLASASTLEAELRGADGNKTDKARRVGELLGQRAIAIGANSVVFDRAGDAYHGRIAALADGARSAGLEF